MLQLTWLSFQINPVAFALIIAAFSLLEPSSFLGCSRCPLVALLFSYCLFITLRTLSRKIHGAFLSFWRKGWGVCAWHSPSNAEPPADVETYEVHQEKRPNSCSHLKPHISIPYLCLSVHKNHEQDYDRTSLVATGLNFIKAPLPS